MPLRSLFIVILWIPSFVFAQNKEQPVRDSYETYFQCYKKLKTIPYSEGIKETKRKDIKNPIALFSGDKDKVYIFGDQNVRRYDLKNPHTDDNGTQIFENMQLVFDEKHHYKCVNIGFFKDGEINFNCDDQDIAKEKIWPELSENNGRDQKDEQTVELLRGELAKHQSFIEHSKLNSIQKGRQYKLLAMYEEDLVFCRDQFKNDEELYVRFKTLATRALGMKAVLQSTQKNGTQIRE